MGIIVLLNNKNTLTYLKLYVFMKHEKCINTIFQCVKRRYGTHELYNKKKKKRNV